MLLSLLHGILFYHFNFSCSRCCFFVNALGIFGVHKRKRTPCCENIFFDCTYFANDFNDPILF